MKTERKSTGFFLNSSSKMKGYQDDFMKAVMNGLDAEEPEYSITEWNKCRKHAIAAVYRRLQLSGQMFCSEDKKLAYAKWCICQIAECSSFCRISPSVLRNISFMLNAGNTTINTIKI